MKFTWKQWMEDEPDFHLSTNVSFADIMVPTMDTVRSTYMLDLLLVNNIPVSFHDKHLSSPFAFFLPYCFIKLF